MNNHDQYNPLLQSDPESSDSDAEDIPDTLPTQTHTVTFKCVGSIHDIRRQLVLSRISKILRDGGKVDVRIHPVPENLYDSKAITFQCHIVKLAWAKYLVWWSRLGAGFYAAFNISLNGEWHRDVIRSQSTR